MRRFGLIGLLCALVSLGCARRHETTHIGRAALGARFTVLHPQHAIWHSRSWNEGDQDNYEADFGRFKLATLGRRLKIDGCDYGELQPGADAVIDARHEEITVTVNGVERTPIEKP
jgi:hypothetical protein